jgi:hypothetical protein
MDYKLELVLIPADFSDPDGNIWVLQEVGHHRS